MNKPAKWILKSIGMLLAVVLALILILIVAGDYVIKGAVTGVGPKVLGVPVGLEQVHFRPLRGQIGLKGLDIGNPEGFAEGSVFSLDEVYIHIDLASLPGTGPIVIHEVTVDNIGVLYERKDGSTNIDALLKNLGAAEKKEEEKEKQEKKPGRDVIIEKLTFKGGTLAGQVTIPMLNAPLRLNLPLPAISMSDLGKSKPTTLETVIAAVVEAINNQIIPLVQQAVTGAASAVGDAAKAVGGAAGGALKSAGGAAGDAAKSVGGAVSDAAGGAVKAIGGLLGGKSKE